SGSPAPRATAPRDGGGLEPPRHRRRCRDHPGAGTCRLEPGAGARVLSRSNPRIRKDQRERRRIMSNLPSVLAGVHGARVALKDVNVSTVLRDLMAEVSIAQTYR